jgi:hypothetical protein
MPSNQEIMALMRQQQYEQMRQQMLQRNMQWAQPDWQSKMTQLPPEQEQQFLAWVQQNKVPFNPADKFPDYDMRGFWLDQQKGNAQAQATVNPVDQRLHYPDTFKTPYHESFSAESQWALPNAPKWEGETLKSPEGKVIFETKPEKPMP